MAVVFGPNPFWMKWGVIVAHLIEVGILSGIIGLFGFLYIFISEESPGWVGQFILSILVAWVAQILASLYSMWKIFKEENAPTFRFILLPLGLLSLAYGLFFTLSFRSSPASSIYPPLTVLFALLVAITDFQTFRMLSPKKIKISKSRLKK